MAWVAHRQLLERRSAQRQRALRQVGQAEIATAAGLAPLHDTTESAYSAVAASLIASPGTPQADQAAAAR